ncbi:MAG: MFS transporter [Oscillospiraceae bacterium]|nr:MFS transporter [Oscillospiraceae bacterium]
MEEQKNKDFEKSPLWTRDFTTITLGSIVSMLGGSMAGFAVSLFVLDYTGSPVYYALYIFLHTMPQIAAPLLAGPLMDKFSRRRTIYLLDFCSASVYLIVALLVLTGRFSFMILAIMTFTVGTIDSVYRVAFESFFPMLISEGNYSKAYSVSSTLSELTLVMIPIATFLYKLFGITPLLFANSACFLVAALFEIRISDVEKLEKSGEKYNAAKYLRDTKDGFRYLFSERGLLCVAVYFLFSSFGGGAGSVITLPWFRDSFADGEYVYMSVWGFSVLGRAIGGMLHYKWKLHAEKKFAIALIVYITIDLLEGVYLYTPLGVMRAACFFIGILGVTSYTIRISATQAYVPNEMRGRFNGAFAMLDTTGALLGEAAAGAALNFLPMRPTLSVFMGVVALAALVFIYGGRRHIMPIYNTQA